MDPNTPTTNTPQAAQGSGLALAVRLALVVVFVGLLAGVAYILSINKNAQTTTGQKEASQKSVVKPTTQPESLAHCKAFTSITEALKTPEITCTLDLSGKNLSSLPNDITKLKNLNMINLNNNNFTQFPSQLLEIPTLTLIDLTNNKLASTPDVSKLTNLKVFILTGNPIKDRNPSPSL